MPGSIDELRIHRETGVPSTLAARVPELRPFFTDASKPGWVPNVRMLNSLAWFEMGGEYPTHLHFFEPVRVRRRRSFRVGGSRMYMSHAVD